MDVNDLIFYILDLAIFLMLLQWQRNTKSIRIKAPDSRSRWIIPIIFIIVAVFGWFRYTGTFRWVETILLLLFALMYWNIGSGLSEDGIVNMGALIKWEDAGKVTLNRKDSSISYDYRKSRANMYFGFDQVEEVRKFLADKATNHSKNA